MQAITILSTFAMKILKFVYAMKFPANMYIAQMINKRPKENAAKIIMYIGYEDLDRITSQGRA